jgi:unsaturated rhamnogalacturonyl hydrolase
MRCYFNDEYAVGMKTDDIGTILNTVANRYIARNPSYGISWRAWHTGGIYQNTQYQYVFDFKKRFPEAQIQSSIYAWSKVWSEQDTARLFEISCFGPVIVYCNGERVYKPDLFLEMNREAVGNFSLSLKKGWNSIVLQFIFTKAGCGGIFGVPFSRYHPLSCFIPSADRDGQKGWLFTQPLTEPLESLPSPGSTEAETGIDWLPRKEWEQYKLEYRQIKRMYSLRNNCYVVGWSRIISGKPGIYTFNGSHAGPIEIYINQDRVYRSLQSGSFRFRTKLKYGSNNILVKNHCGENDWGFDLSAPNEDGDIRFESPVRLWGSSEKWFYTGPFPDSHELHVADMCSMDKPFDGAGEKVYWRLDHPGTVIRPYNDNPLFGHWNYPLGVTLYGLIEAGRLLNNAALLQYAAGHLDICTRFFELAMWEKEQYGTSGINNHLVSICSLDDCGSFGSLMLEASGMLNGSEYIQIADYIADFINNKLERLPDGAFFRAESANQEISGTLWADDLFMCVPFLCRYYRMTGRKEYIDEAAQQIVKYHKYLYRDDKKIMSHVYDIEHNMATGVAWGRGNGWVAFSYSEILAFLPKDHHLADQQLQ